MNRAKSHLARARARIPEAYLEDLCFDAQQAAEKAIKALLIRKEIPFPYVHDLVRLISLLEAAGESIPETVQEAEALTRYAVVTRYPGIVEPVTEDHYREALAHAEQVLRWAEGRLRQLT